MLDPISANQWKTVLELVPHPEGGFYRQNYKSAEAIPPQHLPPRYGGARSFSTAIYFLLEGTDFSAFHRIRQDEIWHFYAGASLTIHQIDHRGEYKIIQVGIQLHHQETPQAVIPAGHLFGATVSQPDGYALVGCTVAPGFEFDDFELPGRADLVQLYPQHRAIIETLTRIG